MFGRPRCREWTPLVTQQLRLRSLIQIVGYNIRPPESCQSPCSFYITLHHTTMSAPFYTSERISSPHPKWKEIDSEITQRMASTNVVVRIWCHVMRPSKCDDKGDRPQDTVIQTWGVYFSGLRYIGANLALNFTSDCFKSNTLVFQMHGGYFSSYKSLKLDIIPPENENEHGSLSSDSSGRTNLSKTIESKFIQHHKIKESRSISPNKFSRKNEKEYSKSNSPVERGFKQNFPTLKTSTSLNIAQTQKSSRNREESAERKKVAPNYIYEHSPDNLDVTTCEAYCENSSKTSSHEKLCGSKIDLSETAESYDLRNESECPKYRYLALSFLKSEIRPSYNATKLQKLHLLQYAIKKKQEAVQEIKERIYKKSALTSDTPLNEINVHSRFKSKSQRNLFSPEDVGKDMCLSQNDLSKNGRIKDDKPPVSNGPRLTLKLNDLLSYKEKPSPLQRAEHVRLTKQLEILRFKRIILTDERDSKLANIRKLKERHAKLLEENQDVGLELMQGYHSLSRRQERWRSERASAAALRELASRTAHALANARAALLRGLLQVFYIEQKDTQWTICDVPLPVCGDESPRASPVSDSVAAGLVAQATTLAAAILAQPMRYKVTLLGSASKILDVTPDLPDPNIPLFSRGGDTTLFWYAMFLLNKCIAQLLWGRGVAVQDMRPTLANLRRLLSAPASPASPSGLSGAASWSGPRAQSLRSLVAGDRGRHGRQFNRFKDSVDGQSPTSAMNLRRHRHSRSVGSYHDDQEISNMEASTTSIMGSEPDIYNAKLQQNESEPRTIVKHSSESEISRLSTDQDSVNKVLFTLGEDSKMAGLSAEKLVRISSNNGDGGNSEADVKKICSEIEDFCSVKTDHDAIDVAKHITVNDVDIVRFMEQNAVKEEEEICGDCETNVDGLCDIECAKNVTEVIVIPSAEAILDTGQSEAFSPDRDQ